MRERIKEREKKNKICTKRNILNGIQREQQRKKNNKIIIINDCHKFDI